MKSDIPFNEFYDYYKNDTFIIPKGKEAVMNYLQREMQWFDIMKKVSWTDLESLTPAEMIQVPAVWIYDRAHITANYDLQDEVEKLYTRYNLPIYSKQEYLQYFGCEDENNITCFDIHRK